MPVIPGRAKRRTTISQLLDGNCDIVVRCFASPRNDGP